MNLPLRVLLGYFLIVGIAAVFVLRIFVNEVRPSVREAIEETMIDAANMLAVVAADDMKAGRIANGDFARKLDEYRRRTVDAPVWHFRKQSLDFRVLVTDANGIVRLDSEHLAEGLDHSKWNDVYRTLLGEYGARTTRVDPNDDRTTVFYVAAPIVDGERIIGVLTVAKPVSTVEPIIARSEQSILRHGAWLLGASVIVGLMVTFSLRGSIRRLRRYAIGVAAGEPVEPPLGGGRELGELAKAMAAMREKLEGKQYVEHYVQALTHELKSPLAALRGAGEILSERDVPEADRQAFAKHVVEQTARLQTTVERMLELSQLEARPQPDKHASLNLRDCVEAVLQERRARAESAGVAMRFEADASIRVAGEADQLAMAVGNLIDNALDHSAPGGVIWVTISQRESHAHIDVQDEGAGIPAFALPRIFERFYSLQRPGGGKGSGLGLAIVQQVAKLHGGFVQLSNRAEGGVRATLALPLAH